MSAENASTPATGKARNGVLVLTVVLAYMGQMMLTPILAPLARAIGMQEWHVGAIISTAALLVTLMSRFWGRRSQKVGPKRVLLASMLMGFAALGGFALVVWFGDRGLLAGFWLVAGAVLTRGALYGMAISAVLPTAQSYLVSQCEAENDRVKAVGSVGAASALAGVLGPALGGLLAMVGGLMLPLSVMPFMMLLTALVIAAAFRPAPGQGVVESPASVSYFDSRVFPFLIVGFMLFLTFSSLQTVVGFMVQDRLSLDDSATAGHTALVVVLMAVTMIVFQAVLAPRLKWSARRLLRVGLVVFCVASVVFLVGGSLPSLLVAAVLAGAGCGFAIPGYMAGPTMGMEVEEQGGLAGLVNANNSATYIVAPVLSTVLYGLEPAAPFALVVALLAVSAAFCFAHPFLRKERDSR